VHRHREATAPAWVAAVLFTTFTPLPFPVAGVVLTALSVAALVLVLVVVRAPVAVVAPAALLLEPVRDTLDFGQVNLLLMALVALDCLVLRPRWPRGALVGLVAAVKLTPAAFVLFFPCCVATAGRRRPRSGRSWPSRGSGSRRTRPVR
jgi:alpha-1,2-mannosyltransferase